MNSFIMAHKRKKSESSGGSGSLSDLYQDLHILTKPFLQYTASDIGDTISIPYTDSTGKILLNNGKIDFEIVGVDHHTTDDYSHTITLMTKNIIRYAAFDAKEPTNPLSDANYGGKARAEMRKQSLEILQYSSMVE